MNWLSSLAGFLVGVIVGMTGVGGGSLMSPILILLFGTSPATAVGTDLWFAAITKAVGGAIHHSADNADLGIVRWLCLGSIPAVLLTLLWLWGEQRSAMSGGLIVHLLGGALILSGVVTPFRPSLVRRMARANLALATRVQRWKPILTVLAGAILGCVITLTSVGAGAIGATMLLLLYPVRLSTRKLVGTDIVHAVPVALAGGIGHLLIGNVDLRLLLSLLIGSLPGIVIGSRLATRMSDRYIGPALSVVLLVVGVKLVV